MPKWCEGDEGCANVGTQRVSHVSGRGENKDMASTGQLGKVFFKTCDSASPTWGICLQKQIFI